MGEQQSLAEFGAVEADSDDETPRGNADQGLTRFAIAMNEAPDNAEPFADDSCPWCLASADDFRDAESPDIDKPVCNNCETVIPVDTDWYQNGEKVCF